MYVLLCMNQISKITLIYWTRIQRKGCVIIVHVLMQTCVLQSWVFVVAPTHSAPPYCGAGFVHVLCLSCVPPPHVTVHVPQEPQLLNPPSTVRKREPHYIMDVGWRCFWNDSIKMITLTRTMVSIAGLGWWSGIWTWTPIVLWCRVGTRARTRLRATTARDGACCPGSPSCPLTVNCDIQ